MNGEVFGKKEMGLLVMVPIRKKVSVEMRYRSQFKTENEKLSYLMYVQRQSGFGDTGLVVKVTLPPEWQVTQVEPVANVNEGKILFNQKLERDLRMGVEGEK